MTDFHPLKKSLLFDQYEIRARLIPGLLVVIPISISAVAQGLYKDPVYLFVGAGIVFASTILMNFVRDKGLILQEKLWNEWGGSPSDKQIKEIIESVSDPEKIRHRNHLEAVLGRKIPNLKEYASQPEVGERIYRNISKDLIRLTHDKVIFPRLFRENVNYGSERNLLAIRPFGLFLSFIGIAYLSSLLYLQSNQQNHPSNTSLVVGLSVNSIIFICWLVIPNKNKTKRLAEIYAERLLEASWQLQPTSEGAKP